jgi:hypothetical protein
MTRRGLLRRDERGVSLVLVLVTLVVFGLLVPVLGQFGSTNGVSGYVLKGNRFDRYAAEAGMQGAIQWAQAQRQAGRQGTRCPDITTADLNGPGINDSRTVTVQCAGFDRNGLPKETDTIPRFAVLATGDSIALSGGGKLRTSGAWWSNGSIDPGNVSIDGADDSIGAHDGCHGITASPCDPTTGGHEGTPAVTVGSSVLRADPVYARSCDAVLNGKLDLRPGLHWDAATLDDVGDGECGNVTITLLRGGPHVFDFQFFDQNSRADWKLVPADRNRHVTIVSQDRAGGACSGPSSPVLFADSFRMRVGDGATVDLCGADAGGQQVALSSVSGAPGAQSETTPASHPARWTVTTAAGGALDNSFQSSPPTPAGTFGAIDCAPDRGGCSGGSEQGRLHGNSASAKVSMTVPDPVPPGVGMRVDHLHLDITHLEQGGGDIDQQHVWIDQGSLPRNFECDLSNDGHELDPGNGWRTNGYDCDLSNVPFPYFPNLTRTLTVNYEVQLKPRENGINPPERSATIGIDAVSVNATFAKPASTDSQGLGANKILQVDPGGAMHVDGTVFVPSGDVQVDFGHQASSTFTRGVIVKTLDVKNPPGQADFIPFSLPGGGNYTDRLATFRAFLGTDTSDASKALLTARVRFCDRHPEGGTATPPDCTRTPPLDTSAPAKILAWDPQR